MSQMFTYDQVYLRPRHSSLMTRSDADVSITLFNRKFKLPIVPANMEDVIGIDNAYFLSENDYFYIFHRFGKTDNKNSTADFVKTAHENHWKLISISVGIGNESISLLNYIHDNNYRVDVITIDVAHADHENVKVMISYIKRNFPNTSLIVGNVATAEGYKYLCDLGADAVKVGIGGGAICTTRYQTGFHLPTAYSVFECATLGLDVPIIADGGAKYYGDIAKALTLGATMVMSGGWFASCLDSPAAIVHGKKIYRGSTAYASKLKKTHIEGKTLELEEGLTYIDRMQEIKEALSSAISYAGGIDVTAFNHVKWSILK